FSLAFMVLVSQYSWHERVNGAVVERRVFWPWYTLIGTVATVVTAFAAERLHRIIHPRRGPTSTS
ncbi:MAG: hypothetical protein N3G20_10140, partial [Verrucomicrobiae bacterium]|nr:hypothetical protein [Verrucomicrobiae bacterium]